MVHYRRSQTPGATYFFTINLRDRSARYLVSHVHHLRKAFREVRHARPFEILAIVVLPDHLHTIIKLPENDNNYPGRWRAIKSHFTHALVKEGVALFKNEKGEYNLWQRRYWEHQIRNENDLQQHVDYIHFNPVKHGHVARVSDWPHSSFHHHVRSGLLAPDWGGDVAMDGNANYGE